MPDRNWQFELEEYIRQGEPEELLVFPQRIGSSKL